MITETGNQTVTIWSIYTRQHALGVVVSEGMSEVHTRTLVDQTHIQDTETTVNLNQPSTGTKLITIRTKLKNTQRNVPRLVFPPLLDT